MRVLSTKCLLPEQKKQLEDQQIEITEYNAINIEFLNFDDEIIVENAIITSQNAAKAIIDKKIVIKNCFCVGEKTQSFLEAHGQNVKKTTHYGLELAKFIVKYYKNESFWFFCSTIRGDDIPNILEKNNISLKQIEVYKTTLNTQTINQTFDAILFFSPSGVQSFTTNNTIGKAQAFCIGTTTAASAKPYTNNILMPKKPTVERVLSLVIKHYKNKYAD